ncbi:MAG: ATP-binding protein [Pseudomonadota bacterium]
MTNPLTWLKGLGLQTQLTLMATALIMLTTALGSYLSVSGTLAEARDQVRSTVVVFAEAASRVTDFGLTTQNPAALAKSVAFLSDVPIIAGVEVRNAEGVQIYREMFANVPRNVLLNAKSDMSAITLNPFGSAEVYRISTPVYARLNDDPLVTGTQISMSDRLLGTVDTIVDLSLTQQRLRVNIVVTIVSSALIAGLGGVFAFFAAKRILRPVRDLVTGLKNVSEGNFSAKLPDANGKELKQLMDGFNVMVDGLRHYRRETLRAREILEQRVEERTQQLFDEKERAEAASRTKSEFLARMSHEIRTPMNGVLGMTELLLMAELGESERRYARTIRSSGVALLDIINDILDFSKIEAGKMVLDAAEFYPFEVAEDVVSMMAGNVQNKPIELSVEVDPNLTTALVGDAVRLRQVLINLTGNAIKFTEHGEVSLAVSLTTPIKSSDSHVSLQFSVSDTGIGIHPEKQQTIFESFMQEDGSTTRRFGGTGLGLAISRQIVDLMGGRITVDSTPGDGSTFSFVVSLPIAKSAARVDIFDQSIALNACIVSNHRRLQELLARRLEHWGLSVECFESVDEMQSAHKSSGRHPDMFFADIAEVESVDLDAWAAYRERSSTSERSCFVWMTSDENVDQSTAGRYGFSHVLRKPVMSQPLLALIQSIARDGDPANGPYTVSSTVNEPSNLSTGLHVLVVEDNKVNQRVTNAMLDKLGASHELAENGLEAVNRFKDSKFDLVLMDCQMPEMDGFSATRMIRDIESNHRETRTPIVALTANALQGDDAKCFDAGMDDYMTKPFTLDELASKLDHWRSDPTQSNVA